MPPSYIHDAVNNAAANKLYFLYDDVMYMFSLSGTSPNCIYSFTASFALYDNHPLNIMWYPVFNDVIVAIVADVLYEYMTSDAMWVALGTFTQHSSNT